MPKPRVALLPLILALFAVRPGVLPAADLRVDQLELLSRGQLNESSGDYEVSSRLFFDLAVAGGDKFSGLLKMDFLNGNIEKALSLGNTDLSGTASGDDIADRINNLTSPRLRTVSVTAGSIFGLPLDISYFVGQMDSFASGDDFTALFGAAPFATALRGPMVYPDGIGGNPNKWYDGIYTADGTGLRLSTTPNLSSSSVGYLYFYQDLNVGPGTWSGDLRYLFNGPLVKAELFAGATAGGAYGIYRGGLLFYASSGDVGEFFAQMGVTHWDSSGGFSIKDMFFLFEPRIKFGTAAQAVITLFYHPSWYDQVDYSLSGEQGAMDAAFDLRFGQIADRGSQGGLHTLFAFRPDSATAFAIDASPYFSLIAGGVRWDFKLDLRVFPFPSIWYGMFKPFIGLKTSF